MEKLVVFGQFRLSPGRIDTIAKKMWEINPVEWNEPWEHLGDEIKAAFIEEFVLPIPDALAAVGLGLTQCAEWKE